MGAQELRAELRKKSDVQLAAMIQEICAVLAARHGTEKTLGLLLVAWNEDEVKRAAVQGPTALVSRLLVAATLAIQAARETTH